MKIAIITYHYPHLKTEQLILKLLHKGYKNICIYAQPFIPRKKETLMYFTDQIWNKVHT